MKCQSIFYEENKIRKNVKYRLLIFFTQSAKRSAFASEYASIQMQT